MALNNLGIVHPGETLYIPFATYDSNKPSASVTTTGLVVGDIAIYKDGSLTQRASTSGFGVDADVDALTGVHWISINLADNTTAGFYAAGSRYVVMLDAITVDAATVRTALATFEIGYKSAVLNTTIATLSTQTSFTLTNGPAENDALNGCVCVIHDVASKVQLGFQAVLDYTGASKTVTLPAGVTFTAAATDNISFFPPSNTFWIAATTQTGNDVGADANNILADTEAVLTDTEAAITERSTLLTDTEAVLTDTEAAITERTTLLTDTEAILTDTEAAITERSTLLTDTEAILADTEALGASGLTPLATGTAQSATASTIVLAAAHTFADDELNGNVINITGGTGVGQSRLITDYAGATDTATITPNWTTNPGATSTYEVVQGSANVAAVSLTAQTAGDIIADTEAILVDTEALDTATLLTDTEAILTDTEAAITERTTLLTDTEAILTDTEAAITERSTLLTDTEAVLTDTEAAITERSTLLTDTEAILTDSEAVLADTEVALTALATGTAQSATASTIVLAAASAFANDELNGNVINITGGTGVGQSRVITDYVGATDTATITPNWTTNPDATSTYEVVQGSSNVAAVSLTAQTAGDIVADTEALLVDTEAVLVDTEAVIVDTEAILLDTEALDTATLLTDTEAILADTEAAGVPPTVAAIADGVWDELQSAHVTAGSFGEIATETAAILADTEAATAVLTDTEAILADTEAAITERTTLLTDTEAILVDTEALGASGLTPLASGTAQSSTASTIVLAAASTFANDELNGNTINIIGGTGVGQSRVIIDYVGATDTATVTPAWTTQPDATSTYEVVQGSSNLAAVSLTAQTAGDIVADTEAILVDTEALDTATLLTDTEAILTDTEAAITERSTLLTDTEAILVDTEAAAPVLTDTEAILTDTEAISSRVPAALVGGRMDSNVSAINNVAGAATKLEGAASTNLQGTASGTPTTTTMVSDVAVTVDDQFKGRIIIFDNDTATGALQGQATDITACTASTNTLTFTALTTAPSSGDTFQIV